VKVLIHACPKRMWYVDEFLIPSLKAQGIDDIEVWNDTEGKGNLQSCMESFAARTGDGGTWHIQDDVLICKDFAKRCAELDKGVVYGFCCEYFNDDIRQRGTVHQPDSWHSFQCVRIPDQYARDCAEWVYTDAQYRYIFSEWVKTGKMDDSFFWSFMEDRHPYDLVYNVAPNLVEHVDLIIGGSVVNDRRGYWARSDWFEDDDLVDELIDQIKARG
jgi:hypothetical protein